MSFGRVLRTAACGLAAGSAALLFSTAAAGKSHMGGDAGLWGPEVPAARAGSGSPGSGAWDPNWDRRHPPPPPLLPGERGLAPGGRATASRHLFLVRHSQHHADADRDEDRTLTALGRQQAELTGRRLASLGLRFGRIVHSSMTRAAETAAIVSRHLPGVRTASTDLLREGFPVEPDPPEPRGQAEAARLSKDRARLEAAFQSYIHRADSQQPEDSYEIFICHANVIRYLVCRALQFPPEGWCRLSVRNGSITHLLVRPNGRVVLWTLGDTGFMPPDIVTRS